MERNIIRNSKGKYVRFAKSVKSVLQQVVLDYLRPEQDEDE